MSFPTVYKWSFISPNFIKRVIFHIQILTLFELIPLE